MTRYDLWNGKSRISVFTSLSLSHSLTHSLAVCMSCEWFFFLHEMIWNLIHSFTHFYNSRLLIALARMTRRMKKKKTNHKHTSMHQHTYEKREHWKCELNLYVFDIVIFFKSLMRFEWHSFTHSELHHQKTMKDWGSVLLHFLLLLLSVYLFICLFVRSFDAESPSFFISIGQWMFNYVFCELSSFIFLFILSRILFFFFLDSYIYTLLLLLAAAAATTTVVLIVYEWVNFTHDFKHIHRHRIFM